MGLTGRIKTMYKEKGFKFLYAWIMNRGFQRENIEYSETWRGNKIKGNYRVAFSGTFREVLSEGVYEFPVKRAKTIVDLGANIGLATIFFKDKYPNAEVICVEPAKENLDFLYKNTCHFEKVRVERKPIWSEEKELNFTSGDCSPTDYFGTGKGGEKYTSITMPKLMKVYGLEEIDILKIDIEGGEIPLLTDNNDWLLKVDNIFMEIHSMLSLNIGSVYHAPIVFKALEKKGFELKQMKEGLYWFKQRKDTIK